MIDLKNKVGSQSLSLTSIKGLRDQPFKGVERPGFQELELCFCRKRLRGAPLPQRIEVGTFFQNVLESFRIQNPRGS